MSDIPFAPEWTANEKWAWGEITKGFKADFNNKLKKRLDIERASLSQRDIDERKLSSSFLQTILLNEAYVNFIGKGGVQIVGAYFPSIVDLGRSELRHELHLDNSLFNSGIILIDSKALYNISFRKSRIRGIANLQGAQIENGLYLSGYLGGLRLAYAKIGREISINDTTIFGDIDADCADVGGNFIVNNSNFHGNFNVPTASISKNIDFDAITLKGKLQLDSCHIHGNFNLKESKITELEGNSMKVDGQINFDKTKFNGKVLLDFISVGNTIYFGSTIEDPAQATEDSLSTYKDISINGATIENNLSFRLCKIYGDLIISHTAIGGRCILGPAGYFGDLDITFSTIKSTLDFQGAQLKKLNLTGTDAFQIIDDKDTTWPNRIKLFGLSYDYFGTILSTGTKPGPSNKYIVKPKTSEWLVNWLKKEESFSPQPWKTASRALELMGNKNGADDIIYNMKEQELTLASGAQKAWMYLLKISIGYGIGLGYFRCLVIALIFVCIGILVCKCTPDWPNHNLGWWIAYNIDQLLPIFSFGKTSTQINFSCLQEIYFIVHNFVGFALASFIVAGLTGLAK